MSHDRFLDRRELADDALGRDPMAALDFSFLGSQTDGDRALQDEVLALFLIQARHLIPLLPGLSPEKQGDAAHLLKGSARGIGAWAIAAETAAYEAADATVRLALSERLAVALERVEAVIVSRLAETHGPGSPSAATI